MVETRRTEKKKENNDASSNADELADNAPGDASMAVDNKIREDWLTKTEEERKTSRERGKKIWETIRDNFGVEHVGGNLEVLYMLLGTGNLNIVKWPWKYHRGEQEGKLVPREELDRIMTRFSKEMLMEWNESRKMMTTGAPEYFHPFLRRLAKDKDFILILDRMDYIGKELISKSAEIANAVHFHYLEGERPTRTSQYAGKFQGGSGPHGDDFADPHSDYRITDQMGDPVNGNKTLSFHVQSCNNIHHKHTENCYSDSVAFTQPHEVVVIMTRLCAGNFLDKVLHSSEGGGGTKLSVVDYRKNNGPKIRPKVLRELDELENKLGARPKVLPPLPEVDELERQVNEFSIGSNDQSARKQSTRTRKRSAKKRGGK